MAHQKPPAHAPEMGQRILAAWADGTLVMPLGRSEEPLRLPGMPKRILPPGVAGEARIELVGVGEHFAVWRLDPHDNGPIAVRIPHVPQSELVQPMRHEVAALTLAPGSVGPAPFAFHEDPDTSPLGRAYVAVEFMPGAPLPPSAWSPAHLAEHARVLARLHAVPAPGRGRVQLGKDPWALVPASPHRLLPEAEQLAQWVREAAEGAIRPKRLARILDAMLARVEALDPLLAELDGFVLAHGDLCATNVMWDDGAGRDSAGREGAGRDSADGEGAADARELSARYIDFEWAQGDDPARDLAIIGGAVHAGPWYVPMDEDAVAAFVREYARTRAETGEAPASARDPEALRERMRLWTAFERTGMLGHVARRSRSADAYAQLLPQLRDTLEVELGVLR